MANRRILLNDIWVKCYLIVKQKFSENRLFAANHYAFDMYCLSKSFHTTIELVNPSGHGAKPLRGSHKPMTHSQSACHFWCGRKGMSFDCRTHCGLHNRLISIGFNVDWRRAELSHVPLRLNPRRNFSFFVRTLSMLIKVVASLQRLNFAIFNWWWKKSETSLLRRRPLGCKFDGNGCATRIKTWRSVFL